MLMCADQGEKVGYNSFLLPFARILKAYSVVKNWLGSEGPVPEGMSATQAIKNNSFVDRHIEIKEKVHTDIELFKNKNGYNPPYWELVNMAEIQSGCRN